jgi:hypothetical protein
VFNGREFRLDAQKESDATATAHLIGRNLVSAPGRVMRPDATPTEGRTGVRTPFRL